MIERAMLRMVLFKIPQELPDGVVKPSLGGKQTVYLREYLHVASSSAVRYAGGAPGFWKC